VHKTKNDLLVTVLHTNLADGRASSSYKKPTKKRKTGDEEILKG
jgi:hypothetical protein